MAIYLPQTLEQLVRLGANIRIEDANYMPQTLIQLALLAKESGSHITISGSYLPQTLQQIAEIGRNNVTIVVRR